MSDSLFGSARQDVAICGHNTSSITVCVSSVSLHTVTPIHGRHTRFVLLIPHPSCSGMTQWLLLGKAGLCLQAPGVPGCVECRSGWEGAGSVTNWMGRLRRAGRSQTGLQPTTITAASKGGQRGSCSFVINTHRPCVNISLELTHRQQHGDLSLCTIVDSWVWRDTYCLLIHTGLQEVTPESNSSAI